MKVRRSVPDLRVSEIAWESTPEQREESDRRFADKIRADFRNARGEHGVDEPEQLATLDSDPAKQALKKAAAYRRLLMMTLRLLSAAERRAKYRRDQDS